MDLIADSNLVIALEREAKRNVEGPARRLLAEHAADRFFLTFTVAGELACGRSASTREDWTRLCAPYVILPWKEEVSWEYGNLYRALQEKGQLIGTNDLWIAATALAYGMPLVTRNEAEFARLPRLKVIGF